MKLIFYDFEVFKYLWLVVFIEYETSQKTIIINDKNELLNFYNKNKDNIFCGYNSRGYDQFIFKGILKGIDPYYITREIVTNGKSGYQIVKEDGEFHLNNFDISTGFHSLKQLEGFMGSMIKEIPIPVDIDRKLTKEELEEVIKYCTHDIEQTIEVFNNRKEEFDSQLSLIQTFDLPMSMFNKTKAQLSAYILGAVKTEDRNDEFNISIPSTLRISEKYQYIVDWYMNPENRDYRKGLNTIVAGVPHTFAWGGLHGARDNYYAEGIILTCDVASLYPSIMIEYGYLSRNVTEPSKYKEIRDTRLKLKAEGNPMQLPYKIVLNSTFGASKDKHNNLYDPLMANNVCVAGQLLLLDLIDKVEPYCELVQSNTDGLFLKVENIEIAEKVKAIAKEWEQRVRLELEWKTYNKIYQKDVNNYIIIKSDGTYESKGAYVKKLSNIDYDLPIVNKALVNYFIHNKPIEDTINECDDLREFQKIVKVSSKYKYALYGNEKIKEKVLRVFASKDENACGVYKVKTEDRIEKIANTPEKCFIYNDNVNGVKVHDCLDKQYYIDLANKRLKEFIECKPTKRSKSIPSDIKFINQDVKDELIEYSKKNYKTFVDVLVDLTENSSANNRQIEIFIKLNYFKKYGRNKKLLDVFTEFTKGKNKYGKNLSNKTKKQRLEILYEYEKTTEDISIPILEQIKYDIEYVGKPITTYNVQKGIGYILELNIKGVIETLVYGLSTGNIVKVKIFKKDYNKNPFNQGDIVQFVNMEYKPCRKFVGRDNNGNPIYEIDKNKKEWWSDDFKIIKY